MRRLLAFLLAFSMLLCMLPTAYADDDIPEQAEVTQPAQDSEAETTPSDSSEPSAETEPSEVTEPSGETEPSETTEPSEATEPSEETEPSEVTDPSEETEATEPEETEAPEEAVTYAVRFDLGQVEATLEVMDSLSQVLSPVTPETPYCYALVPGDYTYSVWADGYRSILNESFTVAESQEELVIPVALEQEILPDEESEEEAGPYADWTDEEILNEYCRLLDIGELEPLNEFLAALSDAQCTALMAALKRANENWTHFLSGDESGSTMDNARDIVFGTQYIKSWSPDTDHLNCYNRIVLPSDGIITITATKPLDSDGDLGRLELYVYDSSANTVWGNGTYHARDDGTDSYRLYVGLAAGTYYLTMKPGFYVTSGTITTEYSITFTANSYAERECNDAPSSATILPLNECVDAYIGQDGANNIEGSDYFRFTAVAGKTYTVRSYNFRMLNASTAMVKLIQPNGTSTNILPSIASSGEYAFTASSSGIHYLQVTNYSGIQIAYSLGVFSSISQDQQLYVISYNANGGTGIPANQFKQTGESITLSSECPSRAGYEFLGWATSSGASEPEYVPGGNYSADADVTLYAVWKAAASGGTVVIGSSVGTTMANAVNVSFGTSYLKTWDSSTDHLNCYSRISVPADGILTINATKPFDADEYGSLELYLYDAEGNTVWGNGTYNAKSDGSSDFRLFTGVGKGTYYLTIKPGFYVTSGTIETSFSVFFSENAYTEQEQNETASSATILEKNHYYTGYLGNDGASNTEQQDYFSFSVTAGKRYSIRSDHFDQISATTARISLIDPSGRSTGINSSMQKNNDPSGFNYYTYNATQTGICHLKIYNYSSRQIAYSIGIFADTTGEEAFYTVRYDANGGSGAPTPQFKTSSVEVTLSGIAPVRNGYAFRGWALSPESVTAEYQPGDPYSENADVTLYAVWEQLAPGGSVVVDSTMGTKMSNAVDVQFGTRYTKSWNSSTDHLNCYNKITLPSSGILSINATKPYDADEYGSLELYLYNSGGEVVWGNGTYHAQDDSRASYSLFVGLAKGTYYLTLKPGFSVTSGTINTTYNLTFEATPYCEHEPNETAASATPLELNHYYTAFLGNDGASNTEDCDYFRFTATAGWPYTILSGNFAALGGTTAMVELIAPDGSNTSIHSKLQQQVDCDGNSYYFFQAASSGIYQIRVYNYSSRQISYSISVYSEPTQEEKTFTVTYNPTGGVGAPPNQSKTTSSRLRLSSVIPSRPGYSFLGWGSSHGSTSVEYMPGDIYDQDADLNLYALWEAAPVTMGSNLGSTGYTTMSTAVDVSFGTSYTRSWTTSTYRNETYHKLTVPQDGIIGITATKPYDADEYGKLTFTLLNSSGNTVWGNGTSHAKSGSSEEYRLYVGVTAGTYYLKIKPGFSVRSGTITSTYSFLFTPTAYAEKEPNESSATATPLSLGNLYLGYLGADGASGTERYDYYSFSAVSGNTYSILSDNFSALAASTAIVKLIDPAGTSTSIKSKLQNQVDKNGRNYYTFTANSSGTYQIQFYNYSSLQLPYTLGVYSGGIGGDVKTYTVTYNFNGGYGGITKQTRNQDTQLILSDLVPQRDKYVFDGWGLSADADTVSYRPGDIYDKDADITLYALWSKFCTNHQRDEGTVIKAPTCTEDGSIEYRCLICEAYICTEPLPALGHDTVTDQAADPTCTENGLTEGSHCGRCGAVLIPQETIPALGHAPVDDTPYPPTCTEEGLEEGSHCGRCGQVLTAVTIPPLGHTEVTLPRVEPTCTEPGQTEGTGCSVCEEVLVAQLPIPALGHDFLEGLCTRCGASDGVTVVSGIVGESAWRFDPASGTLVVEGPAVPDFADPASAPWYGFAGDITDLILLGGTSAIGENAFTNLDGLNIVRVEGSQLPAIASSNTSLLRDTVTFLTCASAIVLAPMADVDCSETSGLDLDVSFLPAGTQAELRFASSDEAIASVDSQGHVTLTGKLGTVTITVQDVYSIAEPVNVTFTTYYVSKAVEFTVTGPIHANGLPVGETAQLTVLADGEPIPTEKLEFTAAVGSEFASVDGIGVVTAKTPGTAAIHAVLKGNDPLGRSAVIHVRVVPVQTAQGFLVTDAAGEPVDTRQGLCLQVSPTAAAYTLTLVDAEGQPLPAEGYTFASSNTKVAKAAAAKTGIVTLTIPKNAAGACTITAVPKDKTLKAASVSLAVYVRDFTPRLGSSKLTMNSFQTCGVSTDLVESYGNTITGQIQILEQFKKGTTTEYRPSTTFQAAWETGKLTITTTDLGSCANGKYVLRLVIPGEITESTLDLTLTVKNTLPKLTVKQTAKPNLFRKDAQGTLSVTAAGAGIRSMELTAAGYDARDNGDGTITLTRSADTASKTGKLTVLLDGYNTACTASVTIGSVNTKPVLTASPASGTINAGKDSSIVFSVYNKSDKKNLDLEGFRVSCSEGFTAEIAENSIRLTPGADVLNVAKKTVRTVSITLEHDSWSSPVTFAYKLTIQPGTVAPSGKLRASTLTLNSRYPLVTACAELTTDQLNMPVTSIHAECATTDQIRLDYDAETHQITATLLSGAVAPGSYPFTVQPYAGTQALKALKLTVKVVNAQASITAKASGKLDTLLRETSATVFTLTVKNTSAPVREVSAFSPAGKLSASVVDGSELFDISLGEPTAKGLATVVVKLRPDVSYSTKLTYSLRLACWLEGAETAVTKDLSIKVSQSAVKAAASPASLTIYQSQSTERTVTFRVRLSKPANARISHIDLGTLNSLFRTSLADAASNVCWDIDQDGRSATVRVTIRDTSKLTAGKSYVLPLLITPEGNASNLAPAKLNLTLKVQK